MVAQFSAPGTTARVLPLLTARTMGEPLLNDELTILWTLVRVGGHHVRGAGGGMQPASMLLPLMFGSVGYRRVIPGGEHTCFEGEHTPDPPSYTHPTQVCAFFVVFMQSGFALLEAGSVRSKNVKNILLKNVIDACISTLCW